MEDEKVRRAKSRKIQLNAVRQSSRRVEIGVTSLQATRASTVEIRTTRIAAVVAVTGAGGEQQN